MDNNYLPNSNKYKEKQKASSNDGKKIEKVISGKAIVKKKSEASKLADIFIAEDIKNVGSYILMDVIVPTVKRAITDVIKNGVDMLFYGSRGTTGKSSTASRYSYTPYYDRSRSRDVYTEPRTRSRQTFDNLLLETRGEAEDALRSMDEIIESYGIVSVADLYELVGLEKDVEYTDNDYGWTSIRNAKVERTLDGYYLLNLPKPMPIKSIK